MKKLDIIDTELLAADLTELAFEALCEEADEQETALPVEPLFFETDDLSDWLDCPAGDPPPSLWRRGIGPISRAIDRSLAAIGRTARHTVTTGLLVFHSILSALIGVARLPGRGLAWMVAAPDRFGQWVMSWHWAEMLTVRRGFLLGAVAGFMVGTSTIWAMSSLPYLPGHPIAPVLTITPEFPNARLTVPAELAWFFIQFPYISENAQIRVKNHHTFVVADNTRKKEYVVTLGQKFRRVEIYSQESTNSEQVQIFTPGLKRTVWFQGTKIMGQSNVSDGNLWMWRGPLWNSVHLKIYGLADMWLDSPFKRYSCAGFVHKFLSDAGVHVPILDAWDLAKQPWMQVSVDEMEPGDIITIKALTASHRRFWHHRITHVGVYIGHGKFIHAATISPSATRSWVRIADVDDFRPRIDKVLRPPELQ